MKLIDQFEDFLKDTVNLNQTRIKTLEDKVSTIKTFITESDYLATILGFTTQGSWAHKTIIKPSSEKKGFDADLVMLIKPVEDWSAKDYIQNLKQEFKKSKLYEGMVSSKSRCVVLDYASDFHLDIVPIICDRIQDGYRKNSYDVCNQTSDEFEPTDGEGFAKWWLEQDAIIGDEKLVNVARLLKYLRDIKTTFSVKSVLLTTLIGKQVERLDWIFKEDSFTDVPTTLKTIITRMDYWLQSNPTLPNIENPVLEGEDFTRHWNQEKYDNFRIRINQYKEWIENAFDEEDKEKSIKKWQRVFGNEFAKKETSTKVSQIIKNISEKLPLGFDLVKAMRCFGKNVVLPLIPQDLPHVQKPPYPKGPESKQLTIKATEKESREGADIRILDPAGDSLAANRSIKFEALLHGKPPHSSLFKVIWQIVNTGDDATEAGQLRGDFYRSDKEENIRHESTNYRGVHWAKAFLVHRKTNAIHGSSNRFFIAIE